MSLLPLGNAIAIAQVIPPPIPLPNPTPEDIEPEIIPPANESETEPELIPVPMTPETELPYIDNSDVEPEIQIGLDEIIWAKSIALIAIITTFVVIMVVVLYKKRFTIKKDPR